MKGVLAVNLTLLLVAVIWGLGFVPQREGMDYFGAAAFNAIRFALGALTLFPFLFFNKNIDLAKSVNRSTLIAGFLVGFMLFAGATFQQIAIQYTSLANVAFISGLYVIFVPVIGFFLGYRYRAVVWLGGLLALVGLYLMSGGGTAVSMHGDLLVLVSAIFFALHLLVLAHIAGRHTLLVLAFLQFVFCSLLSLCFALVFEEQILPSDPQGYVWVALNGIVVVGVAYTLQVVVMKYAEPFTAALVLSLEGVFGALAGYFVYSELLALAAMVGALMMLLGCVLAQLPNTQEQSENLGPAA